MPPFPSGEISLAPCAPALSLPADEAIANTAIATDITRQFIRAKRPCADGYRWYLRRQEGASNYQALLDDLVREGRVEDACWMLDQFGPTNDVLEVEHLGADALVFAGSVRCGGSADVDGVLRTGRSLSVRGGLRVGGALRVGEDLRVSGALRCDGDVRWHGDARVGGDRARGRGRIRDDRAGRSHASCARDPRGRAPPRADIPRGPRRTLIVVEVPAKQRAGASGRSVPSMPNST